MPDTIYYTLKLQRGRTPAEVFEKMRRAVKKKGPMKSWVCTVDEPQQCMYIDFGDGQSETLVLEFQNQTSQGGCKVAFPLEGDAFDDADSAFKALLNTLYAARTVLSRMEITDDYGLAVDYLESKRLNIRLRELTEAETARVEQICASGCRSCEEMLLAMIREDLHLPPDSDLYAYADAYRSAVMTVPQWRILETWLWETAAFQNQGRISALTPAERGSGGCDRAICVFAAGICESCIYSYAGHMCGKAVPFGQKHAQIRLLNREKFYPAFQSADTMLEKCILTYRFFLSVLDYTGFTFVGKGQ